MFTPTGVTDQYALAASDDLKILVVGAGIAGITAAQLLRRNGRHPVLIERAAGAAPPGYMLALMPMVDGALDDLGVHDRYRAASAPFNEYAIRGHTGRRLRVDPMARILSSYGDYRGISREALINVLTGDGCAVTSDTTVTALTWTGPTVRAQLSTAGSAQHLDFDLVIVADGIHSTTRDLIPATGPVQTVDTGWGGWVVWTPTDARSDRGEELWGAGNFLGLYPVAGRIGVFLGGPNADTAAGPAAFAERMRRRLTVLDPRIERALDAVAGDPDPYYWPLTDCRTAQWTTGRTVLLGDAAAGFLPTAGIGAGMAMESAWVLSRLLRHTDRHNLAGALSGYERTQRPRVHAAQDNSRQLARLMFRRSKALAVLREVVVRFVSVDVALRPIQRLLQTAPSPELSDSAPPHTRHGG
jgi:2-polyprenyl-6-methoxyphenol hydroxylase-like FAD-dependent oxidoreductase